MFKFLRFLGKNISSLILAFALALIVWFAAVTSSDPNLEQDYPRSLLISFEGQDPNLLLTDKSQTQARVRIEAPTSVWAQLTSDEALLTVYADLAGLPAGEHSVDLQVALNARPARVLEIRPDKIQVVLEPLESATFPINLIVEGKPASGYTSEDPIFDPAEVTVSGPQSLVSQVVDVRARINIANSTTDVQSTLTLAAYDANGDQVSGVTLTPAAIAVRVPVYLLGGYRNVIVKVNTLGQVADGYKLTSIQVNPPNVVVFSSDPQKVNQLPGYVETELLDLTDAQDDFVTWLNLVLDSDIDVVDDPKVLVQVSIAVIESSISFDLPVEIVGLAPELRVNVLPTDVRVVLSGPVPVLEQIDPSEIRAIIDLSDYGPGSYSLIPEVGPFPERISLTDMFPSSLNVIVSVAPTPTPTPTVTPTPETTPTPTLETP